MDTSLVARYKKYIELLPTVQDSHGFIDSHECDSLLFTGLIGCIPEVAATINIDAAFDSATGQWKRRPIECPCFPVGSRSSISRDMLLGLLHFAYYNKRLDIIEQVIKYALSNWLIMGEARDWKTLLGRCLMTPGLLATYAWASYKLGGPSRPWLRWIPLVESKKTRTYQTHLSILHVLLRKELTGKISDHNRDVIAYHADRLPNNPLIQYANGFKRFSAILLDNDLLWPSDRLPTNKDRDAEWLMQREEPESFLPAPASEETKVHSGGDYLFVMWLLLKDE